MVAQTRNVCCHRHREPRIRAKLLHSRLKCIELKVPELFQRVKLLGKTWDLNLSFVPKVRGEGKPSVVKQGCSSRPATVTPRYAKISQPTSSPRRSH